MTRARFACVVSALFLLGEAAFAAGLEATITDTFDIKMKVSELTFKMKRRSGTGGKVATLDHVPLMADAKRINVWLAQIATATFTPKAGGRTVVVAVLQGQDDKARGILHNTPRAFFEAKVAEGDRRGRVVRFPVAEVKALKVHTKYEGGDRKPGTIPPLPAPDEDVLWVVSVPLGAEVYAKPFDCKAAVAWTEYVRIGRTPFVRELGPGQYAIQVHVPDKLAQTLRPATKLGDDAVPFERDGWGDKTLRENENVVASLVYTVVKKEERSATLVALFQLKGQTLDEVVESFPEGHSFNFNEKKLTQALRRQQVPKADIPKLLDALHRGGKIIWHGPKNSLLIELTPGPTGWRIGGAQRPKEPKRKDG